MKNIFKIMNLILFPAIVVRFFFLIAIALITLSYLFHDAAVLMGIRGAGPMLFCAFFVSSSSIQLRMLLSNKVLSLTPCFRHNTIIASIFACLVNSVFIFFILDSASTHSNVEASLHKLYLLAFFFSSTLLIFGYWAVKESIRTYLLTGLLIIAFVAPTVPTFVGDHLLPTLSKSSYLLTTLSMLIWVLFYLKVINAHVIKQPIKLLNGRTNPKHKQSTVFDLLPGKIHNAPIALLRGQYDSLGFRICQTLIYILFIPTIALACAVLFGSNVNFQNLPPNAPFSLMFIGGCGLGMLAFKYVEWVCRLKLIWLKTGGNRKVLFNCATREYVKDIGWAIGILVVYVGAVAVVTRTSMFITSLCLISMIIAFSGQGFWLVQLRLTVSNHTSYTAVSGVLLAVVGLSQLILLNTQSLNALVTMNLVYLTLSIWAFRSSSKKFERIDWTEFRSISMNGVQ